MANRRFNQFYNTLHKCPVQLDCNFTVDATNGNGFGVRSVKGAGIMNVFMHTSAAFTGTSHSSTSITGIASGTSSLVVGMPVQGSGIVAGSTIASIVSSSAITLSVATSTSTTGSITYQGVGRNGIANPNPAVGNILIQFEDTYNYYIGGYSGFIPPVSGSTIAIDSTSLTVGVVYIIVSLGTSTAADWVAVGLPIGTAPVVGATFMAIATGAGSGTGLVEIPAATYSAIDHIEAIGDPNQTINSSQGTPTNVNPPYMCLQTIFEGGLATAANNTVIGCTFVFQNSNITNQGY
jgi:hypothetical protein